MNPVPQALTLSKDSATAPKVSRLPSALPRIALHGDLLTDEESAAWIADETTYHDLMARALEQEGSFSGKMDLAYHKYQDVFGLGRLLQEGGRVLDFGCADGLSLSRFTSSVEYHGLDVSNEALKQARVRWPSGNLQVLDPSRPIPFPNGYFRGIACLGVLHHVPRVKRVIEEFERTLAPGGWLFIREPVTDMCRMDGSRKGLSPRERGIPPAYLKELFDRPPWKQERLDLAGIGGLNQIRGLLSCRSKPGRALFKADCLLSQLFDPERLIYRRRKLLEKFAPTFAFYTARKLPR